MMLPASSKKPRTTACAWSCAPMEGEADEAALNRAENKRGVGSSAIRSRAADKVGDEDEMVVRPPWRRVRRRHGTGFAFR